MKKLLFILLMLVIGLAASAKQGKIKYSKFLIYEGEVTDKQPSGNGVLTAVNPGNKKENVFTIEGVFNGKTISNPHITSQGFMPDMKIKGDVLMGIVGKLGKVESFNLLLDNVQVIEPHGIRMSPIDNLLDAASNLHEQSNLSRKSEISIDKLILRLCCVDSKWNVSYEGAGGKTKSIFDTILSISSITGKDLRQSNGSEFYGSLDVDNMPKVLSSLGYKTKKAHLALHIEIDHIVVDACYLDLSNSAYVYFKGTFVDTTNKNIFVAKDDDWTGVREFADGTIIKKDQKGDRITISYRNQTKYEGTIMSDVLSLVKADCDMNNVKYNEGYFYEKDKTEVRYLLGEPYDSLHKRLQSEMSEELVADVENGKLSEAEAIAKYQEAQQAKKANEAALREMLNNHWKADAVGFEGSITCTRDGADAWRTLFGINPAYFTGTAMMALDCYGEAVFVFVPEPSESSYKEGRGRVLQVNSFCQKLANVVKKGVYRIEGNTLYIDDKEFGTFSSDWRTFTHEEQGVLKSVMKVTKKEHISADGKNHTFSSIE